MTAPKHLQELYLSCNHEDLTVALTGVQWHCLLTKLWGRPITDLGQGIVDQAMAKIGAQLDRQCAAVADRAEVA